MSFFGAIGRGFASVLRFSGRDPRSAFWFYCLAIVVLAFVGNFAVFIPAFMGSFQKMQAFAAAHPDQATVEQGPGSYSIQIHGNHPELMPDFMGLVGGVELLIIVIVLLLAAAVCRRLHDTGRRGWWGLMPLPFLIVGFVLFGEVSARMFHAGGGQPDFAVFGFLFLNNLVYLGTLVALIVMLAMPTQPVLNRYGEPPRA